MSGRLMGRAARGDRIMSNGKMLGRAAASGDRCFVRTDVCTAHQPQRRREDREWRREADIVLADQGPCACPCHKRLDEWDCCAICTNGYADLCAPPN